MQPNNAPMTYADVLVAEGKARAADVFRKAIEARDTRDAAMERLNQAKRDRIAINKNIDSSHHQYSADQYIRFAGLLKVWYFSIKKAKLDDQVLQRVTSADPEQNTDLMAVFRAGASEYFVAEGRRRNADAARQKEIYLGNRTDVVNTNEPAKMLNTNIWSWGVNQAFIEGAASNAATIVLITALTEGVRQAFENFEIRSGVDLINCAQRLHLPTEETDPLWHHGDDRPTWYTMELAGLLDLGYALDPNGTKFVPPQDNRPRHTQRETQQIGIDAYLRTLNIPTL
jgi:hypothetical protein